MAASYSKDRRTRSLKHERQEFIPSSTLISISNSPSSSKLPQRSFKCPRGEAPPLWPKQTAGLPRYQYLYPLIQLQFISVASRTFQATHALSYLGSTLPMTQFHTTAPFLAPNPLHQAISILTTGAPSLLSTATYLNILNSGFPSRENTKMNILRPQGGW